MVLAKALVDKEKEDATAPEDQESSDEGQDDLHPEVHPEKGHQLPEIPLHKARYVRTLTLLNPLTNIKFVHWSPITDIQTLQIMTRADFIRSYDHINVFTITSRALVRADSVPMQRAFREICSEPGFEAHLEATLQRISDIESLGRTRELVAKDLVLGGKYHIKTKGRGEIEVELEMPPEDDEDAGK